MSEQLQSMLREAADDRPELALRGDPWRRGRRIRLRRRLAGVGGATVAAAAAVAGTVLLTTPDLTSTPEPADGDSAEPALPDTLYEVPPNIPDISDEPLGEPAAVVYSGLVRTGLFSEATRPLVVGAESGDVRAVRDAASDANAVLSPDGTMLAVGNPWTPEDAHAPPTVLVVDLRTGDAGTYVLPGEGLGGGVENLVWHPDSSRIAVTADVITELAEGGQSSEWVPGWLSLSDGQWDPHGLGEILAISSDGERIVVDGSLKPTPRDATIVSSIDGSGATELTNPNVTDGIAFSPSGQQIATVGRRGSAPSSSSRHLFEIFDAATGDVDFSVDFNGNHSVRLVGWDDRGVLIERIRWANLAGGPAILHAVVVRYVVSDVELPSELVLEDQSTSGHVGIAAAFVDAEVREAQPPEAPFDWAAWVPDPFLLIMFGGVLGALLIGYLRRRGRSGRGSATARGSTDH